MIQHQLKRVGSSQWLQHAMLDHLVKKPKPAVHLQPILGCLLSELAVAGEKWPASLSSKKVAGNIGQ